MSTTGSPAPLSIDATPAAGQKLTHAGKEYNTVKEGLAYILVPHTAPAVPQNAPKVDSQVQTVFYNPIQQFNRDLSVLAIKAFGEELLAKKQAAAQKKRKLSQLKSKSKKRKRGEEEGNVSSGVGVADGESTTVTHAENNGDVTMEDVETAKLVKEAERVVDAAESEGTGEHQDGNLLNTAVVSKDAKTDDTSVPKSKPQPPQFTILDALSATGLRALRYAQEIPFTTSVTANDLLAAATESIKLNVKHNKLTDRIKPLTGNALAHMYSVAIDPTDGHGRSLGGRKYDVIDLDPYGTAAPFLDAAVQAVKDGGLLCITCTDAGVWASNGYPEKAFSLYGGVPAKGMHSHESGLRLILHAVSSAAARYGLAVEPLLSLSIDFYARVFVRVKKSPAQVKFLAGKTMVVYNCDTGCGAWTTQLLAKNRVAENKSGNGTFHKHVFAQGPSAAQNCEHCGMKTHMAGPMYAGPLHTPSFIKRILEMLPTVDKTIYQTTTRIEGMLSMALEETLLPLEPERGLVSPTAVPEGEIDPAAVDPYPFFFIPSVLSKVIHCVTPHENALRGALRHLGYRVTRSHTKGGSIKTDAPWSVVWEVMRQWVAQKAPVRVGAIRENSAGWRIMGLDKELKEDTIVASNASTVNNAEPESPPKLVFDAKLEQLGKEITTKKLVRWQVNPRENWGPMARASGH